MLISSHLCKVRATLTDIHAAVSVVSATGKAHATSVADYYPSECPVHTPSATGGNVPQE